MVSKYGDLYNKIFEAKYVSKSLSHLKKGPPPKLHAFFFMWPSPEFLYYLVAPTRKNLWVHPYNDSNFVGPVNYLYFLFLLEPYL